MAITKRTKGKKPGYRSQPHYGGNALPTRVCSTKEEAREWERQQISLAKGGYDLKAAQGTVGQALTDWLAHVDETASEKEAATTRWAISRLPSRFTDRRICDVTISDVNRALADIRKDDGERFSRSSYLRIRSKLSVFFADLVQARVISANPVQGSRVPEAPAPREGRALLRSEVTDKYSQWSALHPTCADIAYILALLGLRWGEVRALRVRHIARRPQTPTSPAHTVVLVEQSWPEARKEPKDTKNSRRRHVPIPDVLVPIFEAATEHKSEDDFLFPKLYSKTFKKRLRWTETMNGFTLHDLRHTAITYWLTQGVQYITVMTWAGHSSLSVTTRYAHFAGVNSDVIGLEQLNSALAPRLHATQNEG